MANLIGGTVCRQQQMTYTNCCDVENSSFTAPPAVGRRGTITTVQTPNPLYTAGNILRWQINIAHVGTNIYFTVDSLIGPNKYNVTITAVET